MDRYCDTCGTKLPGKRGQGFVTPDGKTVTCGRSSVQKTVMRGGSPSLVISNLPCASVLR